MSPNRTIRKGTPADAPGIAKMHVASWLETYAGFIPEEVLAALSVSHRTAAWESILKDPSAHEHAAVYVNEVGGAIVGFGACGEQRDVDLRKQGFGGEIGAVYVLHKFQRQGIGRGLMSSLASDLVGRGLHGVALWVLRENMTARRFYERCAGEIVGEKKEARGEATLVEVAYGWYDIEKLQQRVRPGR